MPQVREKENKWTVVGDVDRLRDIVAGPTALVDHRGRETIKRYFALRNFSMLAKATSIEYKPLSVHLTELPVGSLVDRL